jgi:hypothetical protein
LKALKPEVGLKIEKLEVGKVDLPPPVFGKIHAPPNKFTLPLV